MAVGIMHRGPDGEGRFISASGAIALGMRRLAIIDVAGGWQPICNETGRIQVYVKRDEVGPEVYQIFKKLDLGDIAGFGGVLFRTQTGELTIDASSVKPITKSLRPLPEKFHGLTDVETRYRQRYGENSARLYHWAEDPQVPADNNFAERALRPLVIARKISFGSQSEKGARTREVLMSILHTLRKRGGDTTARFARALDQLAAQDALSPYDALFKIDSS